MTAVRPPDVLASRTWHLTPEPAHTPRTAPLKSECECGTVTVGPVQTILHYLGACPLR